MKIKEIHVAKAAEILDDEGWGVFINFSPKAKELCWKIIKEHSDAGFRKYMDQTLEEALIAEFEHIIVPSNPSVTKEREKNLYYIYQTLFAILGPVYFALNKNLPAVTYKDMEKVINDSTPIDLTKAFIVKKYACYNKKWARLISHQIEPLERIKTKALIYLVTEAFIRALPEPLEKLA